MIFPNFLVTRYESSRISGGFSENGINFHNLFILGMRCAKNHSYKKAIMGAVVTEFVTTAFLVRYFLP